MLPQAVDFRAEADDLHRVLATLKDPDWDRVTQFKRWTINDIVQHLHDGDLMASASIDSPSLALISSNRDSSPRTCRTACSTWVRSSRAS